MLYKAEVKEKADALLSDDERQPCEVWTRVMGYHRPVSEFNTGKKSEMRDRKYFKELLCLNKIEEKEVDKP